MTYRVYLTIELPGDYVSVEAAQGAAIATLQAAVDSSSGRGIAIPKGRALQARVFAEGLVLSGQPHDFVVDICDGCI